jgi:hypothetical protein
MPSGRKAIPETVIMEMGIMGMEIMVTVTVVIVITGIKEGRDMDMEKIKTTTK